MVQIPNSNFALGVYVSITNRSVRVSNIGDDLRVKRLIAINRSIGSKLEDAICQIGFQEVLYLLIVFYWSRIMGTRYLESLKLELQRLDFYPRISVSLRLRVGSNLPSELIGAILYQSSPVRVRYLAIA